MNNALIDALIILKALNSLKMKYLARRNVLKTMHWLSWKENNKLIVITFLQVPNEKNEFL